MISFVSIQRISKKNCGFFSNIRERWGEFAGSYTCLRKIQLFQIVQFEECERVSNFTQLYGTNKDCWLYHYWNNHKNNCLFPAWEWLFNRHIFRKSLRLNHYYWEKYREYLKSIWSKVYSFTSPVCTMT